MVKTEISQIVALVIFIISYILIFSGRIDRTSAALLGVFLLITSGYILHFMTFEKAIEDVDWEVILLLFGMMTFVGQLAKTGFFRYVGAKSIRLSGGKPWFIFLYLTLITTFVSMLIDNVTTILLMIPLTVEVSELLEIKPVPLILGEAVLSNVGGVATLIGDPPNIIIASYSGYTFNDFLIHLFPPVILSLVVSIVLGKIVYRSWMNARPKNVEILMHMDPREHIKNPRIMKYLLIILLLMVIFFGLESCTGIPPAFVALSGGAIALLITMDDPKRAFESVEWSTLVFFISLFMLVGGLEETGLLSDFARGLSTISPNPLVMAMIILWISALTSSVVDNIPITAALSPVILVMSRIYHTGFLWWALAMGVGVGGNLTPIGSSAGVISLALSKRYGYEITNREWFRMGMVTGVASLIVCTLFLFVLEIMP